MRSIILLPMASRLESTLLVILLLWLVTVTTGFPIESVATKKADDDDLYYVLPDEVGKGQTLSPNDEVVYEQDDTEHKALIEEDDVYPYIPVEVTRGENRFFGGGLATIIGALGTVSTLAGSASTFLGGVNDVMQAFGG